MQRIAMAGSILLSATLALAGGCSSPASDDTTGGTGGSGTGGSKASGGSPGSGGSTTGSGGSGTGGASSGGSTGSGGAAAGGTGGGSASGGASGTGGAGSGGSSGTGGSAGDAPAAETGGGMGPSFFVTSVGAGNGGDLGGLDGADAKCKSLAMAVSPALGAKTWKAYLSTATVNAKDRIGQGPWRNVKGEIIANNIAQLHDQGMDGMLNTTWPIGTPGVSKILDEKGNPVSLSPQRHDILTGTNMAGTVDGTNTCGNWTSTMGTSTVGHSNRMGGGRAPSWNMAHTSGCAPVGSGGQNVGSGGGQGSIYCFATD
jgi:hypothetical protein